MSAIYLIEMDGKKHLVLSGSKTVAVNHVVKNKVTARALTAAELLEHQAAGLKVEEAGKVEATNEVEKQEEGRDFVDEGFPSPENLKDESKEAVEPATEAA